MRPFTLFILCALLSGLVGAFLWNRSIASPSDVEVVRLSSDHSLVLHEPETSAGLCPWRSPEQDRRRYFPNSISVQDQTLILSRLRMELQKRLGHMPTADDNAIIVHRILGPQAPCGYIITRRVRGECGLIELMLATDTHARVLGARIQRHREEEATARAIEADNWLGAFRGKDSRSAWQLGQDIPDVPAAARTSAASVLKEARTVLVLLDVALRSDTSLPPDSANSAHGSG